MLPTDVVNQIAHDRICERRAEADAWRLSRFARASAALAAEPRSRRWWRRGAAARSAPAPAMASPTAKFAGDCRT